MEANQPKPSSGSRILSRYGRLKHKHLKPILTLLALPLHLLMDRFRGLHSSENERFRTAFDASAAVWKDIYERLASILRLPVEIDLVPAFQVKPGRKHREWIATGEDPQFHVTPRGRVNWAQLTIKVAGKELAPYTKSFAFIDRGAGLTPDDGIEIGVIGTEHPIYLRFGRDANFIRLDPIDEEHEFRIETIRLRRVTRFEVLLSELKSRWDQNPDRENNRNHLSVQAVLAADPYSAWLQANRWNGCRESLLREAISRITNPPLLSIVMPVYNPPLEFLRRAVSSVKEQIYDYWELCIADDASTSSEVRDALFELSANDQRIRIVFRSENGNISAASNSAAALASGEYLLFLDQDDELSVDALAEVAVYLDRNPGTDILYSDEDKISLDGSRYDPHFKPDWSPELLLSYMYIGHLFVIRRELFIRVGGFRIGFEGSQDYDLALRASEAAAKIGHIPKVLYHHRPATDLTEYLDVTQSPIFESGLRAVKEALHRRGSPGRIEPAKLAREAHCAIFSHIFPDEGLLISIVIPTKDNVEKLHACLKSLKKTTYANFEIIVVNNDSKTAAARSYLSGSSCKVIEIPSPNGRFNFASLNNEAAKRVKGEYILFLNDDTVVISPRWLSQMAGYLQLKGVGAVGALLIYPDGLVQHAGQLQAFTGGLVGNVFKRTPAREAGYQAYAHVARNYSSVTAACMLTRRDQFLEMGGFDEKHFGVAFNDVDYCYRLLSTGRRIVYCSDATLLHYESWSRGAEINPLEEAEFRKRYGRFVDPYYNPNLSPLNERFQVWKRTLAPELTNPVRALMCAHNLRLEGAPLAQLELARGLKRRGIVDPVICSPEDGPLRRQYEAEGIPVRLFGFFPPDLIMTRQGYQNAINRFAEFIKSQGVQVVYANTVAAFVAIEAAAAANLPAVWNIRESDLPESHFSIHGEYAVERGFAAFGYPYRVIFVSNASLYEYEGLNTQHNFTTIHDALEPDGFPKLIKQLDRRASRALIGASEEDIVLITVGTICEKKGQLDILDAFSAMNKGIRKKVLWYLIGNSNPDYLSRIEKAIARLSPEFRSRIQIAAETQDVYRYYSAADIYVCCSRSESYPRVLLEAMSAGLPIVTTPVHGIKEEVRHGYNAFFYDSGDYQTLAGFVESLARDPVLRNQMSANSRAMLDSLMNYDVMIERYGEVFREAFLSTADCSFKK